MRTTQLGIAGFENGARETRATEREGLQKPGQLTVDGQQENRAVSPTHCKELNSANSSRDETEPPQERMQACRFFYFNLVRCLSAF